MEVRKNHDKNKCFNIIWFAYILEAWKHNVKRSFCISVTIKIVFCVPPLPCIATFLHWFWLYNDSARGLSQGWHSKNSNKPIILTCLCPFFKERKKDRMKLFTRIVPLSKILSPGSSLSNLPYQKSNVLWPVISECTTGFTITVRNSLHILANVVTNCKWLVRIKIPYGTIAWLSLIHVSGWIWG